MQIKDATFVVVDLETTGLSPVHNRILEIGAVRMRGDLAEDTLHEIIDPGHPIPRQVTRITGISDADVYGAPPVEDVLPSFIEFLDEAIFVAHNCEFDWKFIAAELQRAGLPSLENRTLCSLRLARRLLSGLPSKGLGSLIQFFDIPISARHRALEDALATQKVFAKLISRLETQFSITEVDDLLHFQKTKYAKREKSYQNLNHIRQNRLDKLPKSPGVYRMLRKNGKLIYIGKAQVLSDRVRSYFNGIESQSHHTRKMIQQVHDVQWTTTRTELEALLLESQLIKEHQPPFNRAGRMYRHSPFLRFGKIANDNWVTVIEHLRADGAKHYGPIEGRKQAIQIVQALVSLYGVSSSSFMTPKKLGVGFESAKIGGPLTQKGFLKAIEFIEGGESDALAELAAEIQEASKVQNYELAAEKRDHLMAMQAVLSRPHFMRVPLLERSGVILHPRGDVTEVHFLAFGGAIAHLLWPCNQEMLYEAMREFHERVGDPPDRLTMHQIDSIRTVGVWMYRERDHITVLPLDRNESPSKFDAELESVLQKSHPVS